MLKKFFILFISLVMFFYSGLTMGMMNDDDRTASAASHLPRGRGSSEALQDDHRPGVLLPDDADKPETLVASDDRESPSAPLSDGEAKKAEHL